MKKVILISISPQNVIRNLVLFPGSLFELLERDAKNGDDTEIVYMMNQEVYDHHREFFDKPGKHFKVEIAYLKKERSLLQKAFEFFFAYFIYTDTTKTLSTMSPRPDEPPAGGRQYLTPLKIFISKTFGKTEWMRKRFVPFFYHIIFNERPFSKIFDKYQPDLVVIPHLYSRNDRDILAEAKRRGIKTVGMISNWDHLDKYYLPFQADIFLAQSEQIKKYAIRYQSYEENQIKIVGYSYFDAIAGGAYKKSREATLAELGFPPNSKYCVYISGSAYSKDEPAIVAKIIEWANAGRFGIDVRILLRPYIGTRRADRETDKIKFDRFRGNNRVNIFGGDFWSTLDKAYTFLNYVSHADVVMAVYSTAILEAAALDRPLVIPGFDGDSSPPFHQSITRFELREHFKDVMTSGAVAVARNYEQLFSALDRSFKNPEELHDERMRLISDLAYRVDGHSNERVRDAIKEAVPSNSGYIASI